MNARIDSFKAMVAGGQETALLHYSLGLEYLNLKEYLLAVEHFAKAVALNPDYTAAWKGYGKALVESQQLDKAIEIYSQGIVIAEKKRDLQALKEMQVFLKRAQKLRDAQ